MGLTMVLPGYLWKLATAPIRGSALGLAFRLMFAITAGLVVWAAHTWMVVFLNEGTNAGDPMLRQVLALGDAWSFLTGTVLWSVGAWLLASLLGRALFHGPLKTASALLGFPGWVVETARRSATGGALAVAFGLSAGTLIGTVSASRPMALVLALGGLLSLTLRENAVPLGLLRAASQDVRTLLGLSGPIDVGPAALALVGAGAGFLHAAVLPPVLGICDGISVAVLGFAAFALVRVRGGLSLAALLAVLPLLALALPALADDGGWREAGGTPIGWISSPGAIPAILIGLGPGLGSAIGVLIGLVGVVPLEPDDLLDSDEDEDEEEAEEEGEDLDGDGIPDEPVDEEGADEEDAAEGGPDGDLGWVWDTPPDPDDFIWVGGPEDVLGPDWDQGGAGCGGGNFGLPAFAVNLATLGLHVRDPMFRHSGVGPPVDLSLCWAAGLHDHDFGPGWRFAYDEALLPHGSGFALWLGSGGVKPLVEGEQDGWRLTRVNDRIEVYDPGTRFTRVFRRHGPAWLLHEVVDPFEQRLVVERSAGRIAAVVDAVGRRYPIDRDEAGRITQISLPDGRSCRFRYEAGRLAQTWDLAGVQVSYAWEGEHLASMAVGERPRTWSFAWSAGVLSAITDPDGALTRYERDGHAVVRTDPEGGAWRSVHEGGRLVLKTDPLGQQTRQEWSEGRRTALHLPGDRSWRFAYDDQGAICAITDPCGDTRKLTWNADQRLVTEVGPDGAEWHTDWEGNRPVRTRDPLGAVTELGWDERGQLVSVHRPDGTGLRLVRDERGNAVELVDQAGTTRALEYDPEGLRVIAYRNGLDQRTEVDRDGNDRVTRVVPPDGAENRTDWGCCAAVASVGPDGSTSAHVRDGALRLVGWGSGARARTATRDARGSMTSLTDAAGRTIAMELDALGRPVEVRTGAHSERLIWGPDGHLAGFTDARGNTQVQVRDGRGQQVEDTDALGRKTTWTRDHRGRLLSQTDPRGRTIRWRYDLAGRLVGRDLDGRPDTTWRRDAGGRPVAMTGPLGTTEYTWDAHGRVTEISAFDGQLARFGFDAEGRLTRQSAPGLELSLARDARGRVVEVRFGVHRLQYTRDAAGRVVTVARSNGVLTEIGHGEHGVVASIRHARREEPAFIDLEIERDSLGRVSAIRGEVPLLPPVPVSATGESDAADQLLRWGDTTYTFDEAGNRVAGSDGWSAVYDAEGRLVEVGGVVSDYDGLGNRIRVVGPAGTRHVLHDHRGRPIVATAADGSLLTAWVWDDDGPVARIGADGRVAFYHHGANGDVLAVTEARGEVVVALAYDAFGHSVRTDPTWDDPYTWAGAWGVQDEGDGLYRMGRRHYCAHTGRFLQRDPEGPVEGLNRYTYVGNSPHSGCDPSGRFLPVPVMIGLTIFVAGAVAAVARQARRHADGPVFGSLRRVGEHASGPPGKVGEALREHLGPGPVKDKVLRDIGEVVQTVGEQVIEKTPFGVGFRIGKVGQALESGDPEKILVEVGKSIPRVDETPIGWGITLGEIDRATPEFGYCHKPVTED